MLLTHAEGFPPVYDRKSRVLVLGSFPSVKSRAVQFYYGNSQNRFWRTVCGFFGEAVPNSSQEKRRFVLCRGIALWDVVTSCDVTGSSDASIRGEEIADLPALLGGSAIAAVLCNGKKAYELFLKHFPQYADIAKSLPSTSPANPRFSEEAWHRVLKEFFPERG